MKMTKVDHRYWKGWMPWEEIGWKEVNRKGERKIEKERERGSTQEMDISTFIHKDPYYLEPNNHINCTILHSYVIVHKQWSQT